MYPQAIEYGIREEDGSKFYYSKVSEKQHCSFEFEEPGLIISRHHSWIGDSLDGIRKCQCSCDPTAVEIKCPFKGKYLDPKVAFLLEGGTGIFGFAVLDVFLIGFLVFVSKDFGFSVLVFNAVCGFFMF